MTDIVELKTLHENVHHKGESAIEEYQEIQNEKLSKTLEPKHQVYERPNEFDFFTQVEVKTSKKGHKKKKAKKKEDKSLMDIITSELAAQESHVAENVITSVDPQDLQLMYLVKTPAVLDRLPSSWQWRRDTEWGKSFSTNLNPVFPQISQNASSVDEVKPHYVKPQVYDDLLLNIDTFSSNQERFLDIELRNLKFKHHHFFSLEKLLVNKLHDIFAEYQSYTDAINNIEKQIKVNRDTKDNLKAELTKISPKKESVRFDPTVRKYTGQMLELKSRHMEELRKQTEIINMIVSLWSDIEMVREKTKAIKTPYVLNIAKKDVDDREIDIVFNDIFNTEFTDLLDKEEYNYVTKYMDYKGNKYEVDTESKKKKLPKPKLEINEDQLKEEAEKLSYEIVKKRRIQVNLCLDDKLQRKIIKSNNDAVQLNYYFKVYVDDAFVCESELYSGKTFDFRVHESLSVQILPQNIFLTVVLFENNSQISSIKLNLNEVKRNTVTGDFNKVELTTTFDIAATDKYIGSGNTIKEIASAYKVRLKSSNVFKGKLYTNCETNMKISWNDKQNFTNHDMVTTYKDTESLIARLLNGIEEPTFDTLKYLIEKVYDKNIDEDEEIINKIEALCKKRVDNNDQFPIDEDSPEFIRIKLLHLRNKGEFTDVENKLVPLYPSQISTEQLNCLQKSNLLNLNNFNGEKYSEMDPIELQRFIGAKYVESLNKNMLKNLNDTLLKKSYRDVVLDFQDLSLRGLFSNQPNLSLRNNGSGNSNDKEVEIYVTIFRGFNLPERTSPVVPDEAGDHEDTIAGFKLRSLRPYVKLYYQGQSAQSATAIGCHPTWNQTLKITANSETRQSHSSSMHINIFDEQKVILSDSDDHSYGTIQYRCHSQWLGCLKVPVHSLFGAGKLRGTFKINTPPLLLGYESVTKEKETNSFIPQLSQLLKKESSFLAVQITTNKPPTTNHFIPLPNDPEDYIIKHLNTFLTEYQIEFPSRNFHLTFIDSGGKNRCVTEFLQPIALPDFVLKTAKRSDSAKSSNTKSSSSRSDKRNVDVEKGLGTDVESPYSTYERSSKLDDVEKMMNCVIRYVSLIPTYDLVEDHVVTLMGVELLRVLHGSALDHTLLLASYFLYLGLKIYIVVGLGLPRGQSSFVLTKYDLRTRKIVLNGQMNEKSGFMSRNDGFVWHLYDAVKGERFELRDVSCPLKTVDYIFDNENIWVNIQASQDCENVSFDLTKTSEWRPVFDKNIFVMKAPILTDANLYKNPVDTEQLRNALETRIKTKIQKWRSHSKTIWNRYCSTVLRESVPLWEYWSFSPNDTRPVFGHRLKQLMLTYKVYGFPLNLPYANTKTIISTIKSTNVHVNDDPNVDFGLAVEVYGYPNNVLSVWVFLASIIRI